ncbi:MAG: hypothetical protein Q9174_005752 [Haloplaca sp. 1 TL-2023]
MIQQSKSIEAMMILGALYAEDVFRSQSSGLKEDKSTEVKKAIALLEAVRLAWKDPQKKLTPDSSVLVYLARLYESDQPEKALQCLLQVEQITINDMPDKDTPPSPDMDLSEWHAQLRENLSPQLLNNIGCLHAHPSLQSSSSSLTTGQQQSHYQTALTYFQTALNACIHLGEAPGNTTIDTDALVTTISYNLARIHELCVQVPQAQQIYTGLLARHADYTPARTRLAYLALSTPPQDTESQENNSDPHTNMNELMTSHPSDLELRALYAWYLHRSKKRPLNIAEDPEQRHYKHTLQHYDKHDRYSLTGMGNLYLVTAREMRRDTDADRQKRSKMYEKAVEFFDKALQLDGRNAYAAMGIAIALVEDKKDFGGAVQLFSKVRETVRGEASVFVNLGHVFAELKQYSRSIESYEAALTHFRSSDPQILACLGRVYLLKGKLDKSPDALQTSLSYSQRALSIAPQQIHFQFNIAFVQIQLAQLMYILPETQRTLSDVTKAAQGLEEAIESFSEIAQSKNPPYPRHDIEQRATMGRNTTRRQLERAIQSQREYEEKNAAKLQEARELREAEMRRREEERRKAEEAREEEKRKVREERDKMAAEARELAQKRAEEERAREEAEFTTDSEGERVKRTKKKKGGKRKKRAEDSGSETEVGDDGEKEKKTLRRKKKARSTEPSSVVGSSAEEGGGKTKKKRKRLARKGKDGGFKSQEMVVESESEGEVGNAAEAANTNGGGRVVSDDEDGDGDKRMGDDDGEDDAGVGVSRQQARRGHRRLIDDDDEEEYEEGGEEGEGAGEEAPQDEGLDPTKTTAEMEEVEGTEEQNAKAFAENPHGNPVDETVGAAGDKTASEYTEPVL